MSRRGRAPPSERTFREEQMRIHNLYTDANGESHFRDIEVEWAEERRGHKQTKKVAAAGGVFRATPARHNVDSPPAPPRQYILNHHAPGKDNASRRASLF